VFVCLVGWFGLVLVGWWEKKKEKLFLRWKIKSEKVIITIQWQIMWTQLTTID
jgi:hypothetical protein